MGFLPPLVALLVLVVLLVVIARVLGSRITIYDHEVGLLYVSGKLRRPLGPGGHWILQPFAEVRKLDLRPRVVTVPGQGSADLGQRLDQDESPHPLSDQKPEIAVQSATSFEEVLYADAQGRASRDRRRHGGRVARERALVARNRARGTAASEGDGARVVAGERGAQDLIFPPMLRQVFHQVVEARKASQASLERARGEVATLRSLANAARMLENNPALLALRTLETVSTGSTRWCWALRRCCRFRRPAGRRRDRAPPEEGGVETED